MSESRSLSAGATRAAFRQLGKAVLEKRRSGGEQVWAILGTIAVGLGIWGAVIVNSAVNQLNEDLNNTNTGALASPVAAVQMINTS